MLFLDKLVYHISYCTVAWNLGSLSGNVHALCWVRSFLSGPGTGGRIRYYPTDREPNSDTVRIPRSPRTDRKGIVLSGARRGGDCSAPLRGPPRRGSSASPPRRFGGSLLRHSLRSAGTFLRCALSPDPICVFWVISVYGSVDLRFDCIFDVFVVRFHGGWVCLLSPHLDGRCLAEDESACVVASAAADERPGGSKVGWGWCQARWMRGDLRLFSPLILRLFDFVVGF